MPTEVARIRLSDNYIDSVLGYAETAETAQPPAPEGYFYLTVEVGTFLGGMYYDPVTGTAAYPPAPLSDTKVARVDAINAMRTTKLAGGFVLNGHTYQCDTASLGRIDRNGRVAESAYMIGGISAGYRWADPDADFYWIDSANANVLLTAKDMADLALKATQFESDTITYAAALKATVNAIQESNYPNLAAANAAVNAIDITTGWPQ